MSEIRLIDADELKKELARHEPIIIFNRNYDGLLADIIDNAPTVDIPNCGGQVVPDTLQGWRYEERQHGEWIDYNNTFYKCPDCGYLLEKCCPQCQNKVILPKGGAE